ncbi:MAG: diaminopimelate epimerase [Gemmatimonadota bacterium]
MSATTVYKMTGSGNDFVFLDGRSTSVSDWPADRVRAICDRRRGVGADGLVVLDGTGPGRIRMTYLNADGSRVDMCGNAALCSTRLAQRLGIATGDMTLESDAGDYAARCVGPAWMAEIGLGDIPLPQVAAVPLEAEERRASFGVVGVPHVVLLVDDVAQAPVVARGRALRYAQQFQPAGTNVNFVSRVPGDPEVAWQLRTYERGVEAETLACGTGTVASVLALAALGEAAMPCRVRACGGGILSVSGSVEGGVARDVWLRGEGRLVFRASWEGDSD